MKSYNEIIAPIPNIDLILISRDDGSREALAWSKKAKFPWPQIMKKDTSEFLLKYYGGGVPTYVLIDREGTVLAKGKAGAFAKIAELAPEA